MFVRFLVPNFCSLAVEICTQTGNRHRYRFQIVCCLYQQKFSTGHSLAVQAAVFCAEREREPGVLTAQISPREGEANEKSILPVFAALHDGYAGAISHRNRPRRFDIYRDAHPSRI